MKSMRIKVENKGSISPETLNHTYVQYLLYYVVYYLLQRILLISQVFIYSTYFSGKIFFTLWTIWHQSG